jgi:hypothetical protein
MVNNTFDEDYILSGFSPSIMEGEEYVIRVYKHECYVTRACSAR